jgi:hypothetical protein
VDGEPEVPDAVGEVRRPEEVKPRVVGRGAAEVVRGEPDPPGNDCERAEEQQQAGPGSATADGESGRREDERERYSFEDALELRRAAAARNRVASGRA